MRENGCSLDFNIILLPSPCSKLELCQLTYRLLCCLSLENDTVYSLLIDSDCYIVLKASSLIVSIFPHHGTSLCVSCMHPSYFAHWLTSTKTLNFGRHTTNLLMHTQRQTLITTGVMNLFSDHIVQTCTIQCPCVSLWHQHQHDCKCNNFVNSQWLTIQFLNRISW